MILTEYEAKKLLSKYGIRVTRGEIAKSEDEAFEIASNIGGTFAMKISSPDISHKSDVGGVVLNVDIKDVKKTYSEIISKMKKVEPKAHIEGVLVQEMASSGYEVIVGLKKDAQFGHALMFGLGGIFVEVYKDVTFRIVPVDKEEALRMIPEIKAYQILKGLRGKKPANIDAIADVIVAVSNLAEKEDIIELDINPLIVSEKGAIAVDARAIN